MVQEAVMAQILVRDLEPQVVDHLKDRAKRHGRSLQSEVRLILQEAVSTERPEVRRRRIEELWKLADEIRERSVPQRTDSVEILRRIRYGADRDD
jgi:plasmid stability protein